MLEVRSGLEADILLMAQIKAASKEESLALLATEFNGPLLRVSRKGHMLFANVHGANLIRTSKIKLGDLVPIDWHAPLQQSVEQTTPVTIDWPIDDEIFSLTFVGVPDAHYVSVFARLISGDYHEQYRDPLTQMPNRVLFLDRLRQATALALRNDTDIAVHVIRLQHFKGYAESLGFGTADGFLCKLGERLTNLIRASDTVARIGRDEFAVIQVDPNGRDGIEAVAKKLQNALETPVVIAGERLLCRAHIGISIFPNDAETAEDLLHNAVLALDNKFQINEKGYHFFLPPMRAKMDRRWSVEYDLEKAIEAEDFTLYFQPKQLLETGRISGMEALVRWNHPEHGEISPVEFIPIAERSRLILPLGAWILRKACEQTKKLNDLGLGPLKVAVNLSALQFNDEYIVDSVRGVLDETGISPEFLELEITESIAMSNATSANETFKKMADLGVSMSIDDFGTGYSSLAYLKNFKVQRIKIDKLFIDDIGTDMGAGSIARAITTMSHSFGMDVTAEGVTNKEQVAFLRRLECDEIQGEYFSDPLSYDELAAFIKSFKPPEHYEQGVLNWSDFRELSEAISGNLANGKRRDVKDQRNSKK